MHGLGGCPPARWVIHPIAARPVEAEDEGMVGAPSGSHETPAAGPAAASAGAPLLAWSSSLDTGLDQVDQEHRALVDIVNALARQRQAGAGVAVLRTLCDELGLYARVHFAHEESLLDAWPVDPARKAAHRHAHRAFAARIARAGELVAADPAAVVDHLLSFLVKWLVHHIRGVDAAMAREIEALHVGAGPAAPDALETTLVDTVSDLYDSLGERTLEMVAVNARLRQEVARREAIEAALRASEERFSRLYRYAPVALWEIDWSGARRALAALPQVAADAVDAHLRAHPRALHRAAAGLRVVDVNEAALNQAGFASREALTGRAGLAMARPGLPALAAALATLAAGEPACSGEFVLRRPDGGRRDLAFNIVTLPDAEQRGRDLAVVATLDVTDSKREQELLRHRSLHDALTGLPNRVLLGQRLEQALAAARRERRRAAVMFVDLDGFKPVNDRHGHAAGDSLLAEAARRLSACVRATDTVARIGGDEFALVVGGIAEAGQALAVAEKVRRAIAAPFQHDGLELRVSSSIGVAVFPEHGSGARALLRHADTAMYAAKAGGRDRVCLYEGTSLLPDDAVV